VSQPAIPNAVEQFDAVVDGWFDHLRGKRAADRLFYAASEIGDFSVAWHLIAIGRGLVDHDRIADGVALSVSLGVESLVVNQGIKRLFRRERPTFDGERPHHLRRPLSSSFPSGHASSAFCAALILSGQQPALTPVWYGLAGVIAVSRLHVRIHHASDVVGGVVIGTAIGLVARSVIAHVN
jgi:undecaprenyl-diphosphatase